MLDSQEYMDITIKFYFLVNKKIFFERLYTTFANVGIVLLLKSEELPAAPIIRSAQVAHERPPLRIWRV
jgi:hypothetical protein